jgi:hypothetical protein
MKMPVRFAMAAAAASLVVGSVWAGWAGAAPSGRTIDIHAATAQENFMDASPAGFSLGDVAVIHDHLTNAGGKPAGHDGVVCTVTLVTSHGAQFQCLVTAHLKGGDLTAQGLFTEPFRQPHHPTVLFAVTGGTGAYAGADGFVRVHEVSEEETDYTFHLLAS